MQTLEPQIFGALIGASVTFIVSIVVLIFTNMGHAKRQKLQHKHEHETAMATLYRNKLEDIYTSFLKWERMFGSIYVSLIGYVKGELSEKDAFSMFKNHGTSGNIDKVEMLISLYYPELKYKYKSVMAARGRIVKYFPPNQSLIGDYSGYCTTQQFFEESAVEFKEALKDQIAKLL